jgi:3-isopropylmalate/(R)-2-methylmalate dehydratase small subunit
MKPFTVHSGIGVPLGRANVDTDQILAAQFLKRITRTGYEDALFSTWRAADPGFVLNREPYRSGSVLVAGENFGCGSSREHAVWALLDYGFRAVIAPSFADIFRSNAGKSGLLAAQCDAQDVARLLALLESNPGTRVSVDLHARTVDAGAHRCTFAIDDYTRWRLLEGLDDIGITLQHAADIDAFEARRAAWLPTTRAKP